MISPVKTNAYITLVMNGDKYVPGALVLAAQIKVNLKSKIPIYCMITKDVSSDARAALRVVFDAILEVEYIESDTIPFCTQRQTNLYQSWISKSFTKWNCLDPNIYIGNKVCVPSKILFLDADVLPRTSLDHLFDLRPPACSFSNWMSEAQFDRKRRTRGTVREIYGRDYHSSLRGVDMRRDLDYGEEVPREKIAESINWFNTRRDDKSQYSFACNGCTVLLSPSDRLFTCMNGILESYRNRGEPYGHRGVWSGHDEQILCELFLYTDHPPLNLTAGYAWSAGKDFWVSPKDRYVIHYYGDEKPWFDKDKKNQDKFKWKDEELWWSVAKRAKKDMPEFVFQILDKFI